MWQCFLSHCIFPYVSNLLGVTHMHFLSLSLSLSLTPDDLWISFISVESKAHLFWAAQVLKQQWKKRDANLQYVWVIEEETERKEGDGGGRGRQCLSHPSYDLIKAIHHIWIIRQQHGSHDKSSQIRTHTHTHTPIPFLYQETAEESPNTVWGSRLSLAQHTLRTIGAKTPWHKIHTQSVSDRQLGAVRDS